MITKLKSAIILPCGVLNSGFKIFLTEVSGFQTGNCNFKIDLAIKVCGFHCRSLNALIRYAFANCSDWTKLFAMSDSPV
jgi:hypothetical protein